MTKGSVIIYDSPDYLSVNCEDYDVECFGGCDYEFTYSLDKENRNKLWRLLRSENVAGSMEQMIKTFFGTHLELIPFGSYCDRNGIEYKLWSWVS